MIRRTGAAGLPREGSWDKPQMPIVQVLKGLFSQMQAKRWSVNASSAK
jgi:hypothetical protein